MAGARGRIAGWVARYLPLELLGTASAIAGAWVSFEASGSLIIAAFVGTVAEGVGYYALALVRSIPSDRFEVCLSVALYLEWQDVLTRPEHLAPGRSAEEATEFVADFDFRSLKDFSPENIQKRVPGQRNDIADLKNVIDLLYRMKDRWALPSVKRAWSNPAQRKQILAALARLRGELEKVAGVAKGGE